jgi:hypothetical protein
MPSTGLSIASRWEVGQVWEETTSVQNHKKGSEFRFRAVITEEGSQLLSLEH